MLYAVSEEYKKIRETCKPRGECKQRYWFFADTPNIAWIVTCERYLKRFLMESRWEPIFTDFSNIGDDVQYRYFN